MISYDEARLLILRWAQREVLEPTDLTNAETRQAVTLTFWFAEKLRSDPGFMVAYNAVTRDQSATSLPRH